MLSVLAHLFHSSQHWPFSLNWLPPGTCLVGGSVRDAGLNRQGDYLDLDFVVPVEAVETARRIARHYSAGFVVLDEQRQIARVVFERVTADFAQQQGDLEADLRRRDFTINAIAYCPHTSTLIDPLGGLTDLDSQTIRMISPANLQDDPLRLLRAYRQAAQLNFVIEPTTQATIRALAPLLETVAAERVQTEVEHLLASPQGSQWLKKAGEDGLLQAWFANVTVQKLDDLARVDDAMPFFKARGVNSIDHSHLCLAKLACLSDDPAAAELELERLKYSRYQIRTVVTILRNLPRLLAHASAPMSLANQYFFFLDVGEVFPAIALLAAAKAPQRELILSLLHRYFNPDDPVAHPQPLVTGNDLIKSLHLSPGPRIGTLLTTIQIAHIEGKIATKEEALQFAASLRP